MTPAVATVVSFATLGVVFVTRPLGAVIFGHFGDTIGHKAMLATTVVIMRLSTFLIRCLPSFAAIRATVPVLLIVLRLLQGLAVGGEWGGATTMMIEFAPSHRRGFYGTFVQLGNVIGVLVSTGAFALVSSLPESSFLSWGRRIPFFASLVLLVVGGYIRLNVGEPPAFLELKKQWEASALPIHEVF